MKQLNSPIPWLGGKRLLRKTIIERFPKEYDGYAECFAGGLWVLFALPPDNKRWEAVNDINSELINFYEVVSLCKEELLLELQYDLFARELFIKYKKELEESNTLSNIQRAKRFYYVLKASFGAQSKHFGVSKSDPPRLNFNTVEETISNASKRLNRVIFEKLPWQEFINRYDRKKRMWYFDPPYDVKGSKGYVQQFSKGDYIDFKDRLKHLQGHFILSINDSPFMRELFSEFIIEEVSTTYTVMKSNPQPSKELLIKNF